MANMKQRQWQQKANVERITRRLDKMLTRYKEEGFGIPVDLEAMARIIGKEMNVQVSIDWDALSSNFGSEAVLAPVKPDLYVAKIRTNLSFLKKRFAIGHELGHLLIKPEYGGADWTWNMLCDTGRWLEKLCDEISGSILCPYFAIDDFLENDFQTLAYQRELFGKRRPEVLKLGEMARIFQVQPLTLYHYVKKRYKGAKIRVDTFSQILDFFSHPKLSKCDYEIE